MSEHRVKVHQVKHVHKYECPNCKEVVLRCIYDSCPRCKSVIEWVWLS